MTEEYIGDIPEANVQMIMDHMTEWGGGTELNRGFGALAPWGFVVDWVGNIYLINYNNKFKKIWFLEEDIKKELLKDDSREDRSDLARWE